MNPTEQQQDTFEMPKRDITALILLASMFLALAVVSGASLSSAGSGLLQGIVSALGLGRTETIESEQHRQAAVLANLGRTVSTVSAEVGALSAQIKLANHNGVATVDRFALLDTDIAALVAELHALRAAQRETASSTPWRDPVERLDNAVADARTDALALRSSLDTFDRTYRKDIGSITRRLDSLEQTVARDLTSSIRTPVRKKVRRKPRPVAAAHPKAGAPAMTSWGPEAGFVVPGQPAWADGGPVATPQ